MYSKDLYKFNLMRNKWTCARESFELPHGSIKTSALSLESEESVFIWDNNSTLKATLVFDERSVIQHSGANDVQGEFPLGGI